MRYSFYLRLHPPVERLLSFLLAGCIPRHRRVIVVIVESVSNETRTSALAAPHSCAHRDNRADLAALCPRPHIPRHLPPMKIDALLVASPIGRQLATVDGLEWLPYSGRRAAAPQGIDILTPTRRQCSILGKFLFLPHIAAGGGEGRNSNKQTGIKASVRSAPC